MGVPAFFKWLTLRYKKIVIEAKEFFNKIKSNSSNDQETMPSIDNLYFDMNGIIHPCAHPEGREPPLSLAEIFNSIFDYCDKIIRIIKPQKLIFFAIDGVAPRAKMNQQRSRRFRAALDAQQKKEISEKIRNEWEKKGLYSGFFKENDNNKNEFKFDSNCITPGTRFLSDCSIALIQYIKSRLNNDPLWKNLNIIFSDSSVPGEGEHKILDFIRTQRTYDNYNPNTSHCIYGADADLIMLSLIMHEPNFFVIRESLKENYYLICNKCGNRGHSGENCNNKIKKFNKKEASKEIEEYNKQKINEIEFSLLKIGILRQYLEYEFKELLELKELNLDFERIIDDFVFLCFLVGNDFLPNMPGLKIREGAIDALIYLYKKIRPLRKEYLTNGEGKLNLTECEFLFTKLSLIEDALFKKDIEDKIKEDKKKIRYKKKIQLLDIFRNIESTNDIIDNRYFNEKISILEGINEHKFSEKDFSTDELKKSGLEKFNQIVKEEIDEINNRKINEYKMDINFAKKDWKDNYYKQKL